MRDIKRRKAGVQSTQQITKAMKLVSTVKLQRAKVRALQSKTYFSCMYDTVVSLLAKAGNLDVPYTQKQESPRKAVILLTSNRGLAGGYNSNVNKLVTGSGLDKNQVKLVTIGKKGREYLEKRGYQVDADYSDVINNPMFSDAKEISEKVLNDFVEGKIGEIYIAYTSFKNTVVHEPKLMKLLPMEFSEEELADKIGLKEVLQTLGEEDRKLIELRFYGEKTQSETARLLHTTQVQISRRERRLLKEMRRKLLQG